MTKIRRAYVQHETRNASERKREVILNFSSCIFIYGLLSGAFGGKHDGLLYYGGTLSDDMFINAFTSSQNRRLHFSSSSLTAIFSVDSGANVLHTQICSGLIAAPLFALQNAFTDGFDNLCVYGHSRVCLF